MPYDFLLGAWTRKATGNALFWKSNKRRDAAVHGSKRSDCSISFELHQLFCEQCWRKLLPRFPTIIHGLFWTVLPIYCWNLSLCRQQRTGGRRTRNGILPPVLFLFLKNQFNVDVASAAFQDTIIWKTFKYLCTVLLVTPDCAAICTIVILGLSAMALRIFLPPHASLNRILWEDDLLIRVAYLRHYLWHFLRHFRSRRSENKKIHRVQIAVWWKNHGDVYITVW